MISKLKMINYINRLLRDLYKDVYDVAENVRMESNNNWIFMNPEQMMEYSTKLSKTNAQLDLLCDIKECIEKGKFDE